MVMRRRRGLLLAGALVALVATPWALRPPGFAFADLWLTPDQQGRWHVERGDYARAAGHFRDPMWKGVACYRARDFECALQSFARVGTADAEYDLGIAYARSGQLPAALSAFERALALRPGWREAQENRDLVARLLPRRRPDRPEEEGTEPSEEPDDMKVDDLGRRGKRGVVEIEKLGPDAIDKLWLRNVRTDPALFLRAKFAAETQTRANAERKP